MSEERALSIRQPWAYAIIHLGKDVENREWRTAHRGRLYIHAGKTKPTKREWEIFNSVAVDAGVDTSWELFMRELRFGGIIGSVELIDCVHIESKRAEDKGYNESPWAFGRYLWVFRDPKPIKFQPVLGQLNIFPVEIE